MRQHGECDHTGERSESTGCDERMGDSRGCRAPPSAPVAPAAIVENTAIPIVPPISWPVELRPESIPVSSCRAPVRIATETETTRDAESESGHEHAGEHVAEVAAVASDVREQRHADGGDQERCQRAAPHAVAADEVSSGMSAGSGRECERDEARGRSRAARCPGRSADRANRAGRARRASPRRDHQDQPAADGAVRKSLDPQQGLLGAPLHGPRRRRGLRARRSEPDRLRGAPSRRCRPA